MPDFTPATVRGDDVAVAETLTGDAEAVGPIIGRLTPFETETLVIAEQISAAFRYLAAQLPAALPLLGMSKNIDAAVHRARNPG